MDKERIDALVEQAHAEFLASQEGQSSPEGPSSPASARWFELKLLREAIEKKRSQNLIEWAIERINLGWQLQPETSAFFVELLANAFNVREGMDEKAVERNRPILGALFLTKTKDVPSEGFWITEEIERYRRKYVDMGVSDDGAWGFAYRDYKKNHPHGISERNLKYNVYPMHIELVREYLDGNIDLSVFQKTPGVK